MLEVEDFYAEVTADDLHKYGLIPEFIGRLPVVTSTSELSEEDLVRILTEPRSALIGQYQHLFELDGVDLEFTHNSLKAIARTSMDRASGARGLASVMEETLNDLMYEIPSDPDVTKVVITDEAVNGTGAAQVFRGDEGQSRIA